MNRMIDILELVKRYVPEAELRAAENQTFAYIATDLTAASHVMVFHQPELGWMVSIEHLRLAFSCPDKESALKAAKVITTQIEVCKGTSMEELERVQTHTIERFIQELKKEQEKEEPPICLKLP